MSNQRGSWGMPGQQWDANVGQQMGRGQAMGYNHPNVTFGSMSPQSHQSLTPHGMYQNNNPIDVSRGGMMPSPLYRSGATPVDFAGQGGERAARLSTSIESSSSGDSDEASSESQSDEESDELDPQPWRSLPYLHRGPVIKIIVGPADVSLDGCSEPPMFTLQEALVPHVSPFLEAEWKRIKADPSFSHIALPDVDPGVFDLFIDWIYHGSDASPCKYDGFSANPYALAWILGDKLQCPDFQSYAMSRLYSAHSLELVCRPIHPADMAAALKFKLSKNMLRTFYIDFYKTYSSNRERVAGTVAEWDTTICDYPVARRAIHEALHAKVQDRRYLRVKQFYMLVEEEAKVPSTPIESVGSVVPAKRNADGAPVQKELTNVCSKMIGEGVVPNGTSAVGDGEVTATGNGDGAVSGDEISASDPDLDVSKA